MNRKTKAMLMMVVCSTLWSTAGIFIKWIDWNPMIIAGIRGLISASVLYIYMYSTDADIRPLIPAIIIGFQSIHLMNMPAVLHSVEHTTIISIALVFLFINNLCNMVYNKKITTSHECFQ